MARAAEAAAIAIALFMIAESENMGALLAIESGKKARQMKNLLDGRFVVDWRIQSESGERATMKVRLRRSNKWT